MRSHPGYEATDTVRETVRSAIASGRYKLLDGNLTGPAPPPAAGDAVEERCERMASGGDRLGHRRAPPGVEKPRGSPGLASQRERSPRLLR
jgi:hypothetical protein